MLPAYVRGSKGGIFMFDITRFSSLKNMESWVNVVRSVEKEIPLIMVGGKIDLNDQRSVPPDSAMEIAEHYGFTGYGECSSKTGQYVEDIFNLLTRVILEDQNLI